MFRFRTQLIAVVLVVVASAFPLLGNIFELPKYFRGFFMNFDRSGVSFLQAYSTTQRVLQSLSFQLVAVVFVVVYILSRVWRLLFSPLNYYRNLGDTGYLNEGISKRETVNHVRKRRKIGEVPPVYPNGWFMVVMSAELPVKEVKYVQILGEHLAVFRGEDGVVYILDAYCPHLGANIAVGGQVRGNCIQCPFHGWRFNGESGACVEIPYSSCLPDVAKTRSWHTIEKNHRVYVWYHAEGIEPTWIPEDIEEIQNGTWWYCGQTVHYINAHIQDLLENASDVHHFKILHTPLITSGQNLKKAFTSFWNFGYHEFIVSWAPLEGEEAHCAILNVTQKAYIFGYHLPFLDVQLQIKQIGPGVVYVRWDSVFGKGVITHEVTPVEPLVQRFVIANYTGFPTPKIFAKVMLYFEAIQFERDVMVWNYKTYASKPLLVKEDIGIKKHRKWYQQFYSENSPKLTFSKTDNLHW